MDPERARELLARERARVERELASLERAGGLDPSDRSEPGDEGSEDLYEEEVSQGRREELRAELAAVARAEERLAAGTYGLSVESGEPGLLAVVAGPDEVRRALADLEGSAGFRG